MSGITAIQALSPAETWEAWQALMRASLGEGAGDAQAGAPHLQAHLAEAPQTSNALSTSSPMHEAHPIHHAQQLPAAALAAETQAATDAPTMSALQTPPSAFDRLQAAAPSPVQSPTSGLLGDAALASTRFADASAAVQPMAPALMTPLALQNGPELRWRVQDASAWRALFDDAGQDEHADDEAPDEPPPVLEAMAPQAVPPWAQALLARLREAATSPAATALRPALQAWRLGLPVLLASPAGLASLQVTRDAGIWQTRRWPARWRSARPAVAERWWAVRLGLGPQGRPRTLRDLGGAARLAPGQVSCELRFDDTAPGMAQWADVLVQAPATPSLRALLAARPSLPWLLCNQALWPQEPSA